MNNNCCIRLNLWHYVYTERETNQTKPIPNTKMTNTQTRTMSDLYKAVQSDMLDKLNDGAGMYNEASDLHHYLCNEDYFIIGTYAAKQFLGEHAYDVIGMVQEYENDNFGECNTDLSNPENVVNMFRYIVGEQILAESDTLRDNWDSELEPETHREICEEIECININKVYYSNN